MSSLLPLVHFDRIDQDAGNSLIVKWGHKMGSCDRPFACQCYALFHNGLAVCVVMHAPLITPSVGGVMLSKALNRDNCIELCRLCAVRSNLNRVGLRLWREFVFSSIFAAGVAQHAISYQDADLHTGNTYRFDGWERFHYSHSGTDTRTGKAGRRKWLWVWPPMGIPV